MIRFVSGIWLYIIGSGFDLGARHCNIEGNVILILKNLIFEQKFKCSFEKHEKFIVKNLILNYKSGIL